MAGKLMDVDIKFNCGIGVVVVKQCGQTIFVPPSEIQAVVTDLLQAYADSLDTAEAPNGR
jgi:uncharacterized protein with PhoU and TrkA domain